MKKNKVEIVTTFPEEDITVLKHGKYLYFVLTSVYNNQICDEEKAGNNCFPIEWIFSTSEKNINKAYKILDNKRKVKS